MFHHAYSSYMVSKLLKEVNDLLINRSYVNVLF